MAVPSSPLTFDDEMRPALASERRVTRFVAFLSTRLSFTLMCEFLVNTFCHLRSFSMDQSAISLCMTMGWDEVDHFLRSCHAHLFILLLRVSSRSLTHFAWAHKKCSFSSVELTPDKSAFSTSPSQYNLKCGGVSACDQAHK